MGCSPRFSLLFQIEAAVKLSLPSFPSCVHKWSSFPLFLKAPRPQSTVHKFQWKKLPPICPSIEGGPLSRAGAIAQSWRGKEKLSPCHLPGTNPSSPGARHQGPSPAAPSLGRLFQAPRPHGCGTGGRLMGQVLVPRAGSCPDKVGAEIALGQYSAVATWSCGWSHLRGSREERAPRVSPPHTAQLCRGADAAAVPHHSSLCCAGGEPLLPAGAPGLSQPSVPPAHSHPSAFSTQPSSWGKAKVSASPTVNNSRGIAAFPFITLPANPSCYLCACPPRLSQCSAMPSLHPVMPQCSHILAGEGFACVGVPPSILPT